MIKDFLLVRAAPNLPFGELQHYLQFKHAPLALTVPTTARQMQRYTMNHVAEEAPRDCCLYPPIAGLASVVEHALGGLDGIERITADPRYVAEVYPDEQFMVENLMDGPPQFVAVDEEITVFHSGTPGSARMFDFVRRPADMSREAFLARLDEDAAWAAAQPHYRSAVSRRVHSLVGTGTAPFGIDAENFDAVVEVWIGDPARLAGLMDEQADRRAAFCDPDRSVTALTREHRIRG